MSRFLNIRKQLEERKRRAEAAGNAAKDYKVPKSLTTVLQAVRENIVALGDHTYFAPLNPFDSSDEIEANREQAFNLLTSRIIALGKAPDNDDVALAGMIIDYFGDALGCKRSTAPSDNDLLKWLQTGLKPFKPYLKVENLNKMLDYHGASRIVMTDDDKTNFMARVNTDIAQLVKKDIQICIGILVHLLCAEGVQGDIEYALMSLLISVSKSGSPGPDYYERKDKACKSINPTSSMIFDTRLRGSHCSTIWSVINTKITSGDLLVPTLIANLRALALTCSNVAVTPLVDQIAYRGMTSIHLIASTIREFPNIPWYGLRKTYPILDTEYENLINILKATESNVYSGLELVGLNGGITNLAYLCLRVAVVFGGKVSLEKFQGIGSAKSSPSLKHIVDLFIEKWKSTAFNVDTNEIIKKEETKDSDDQDGDFEVSTFLTGFKTGDDDDQPESIVHSPPRGNSPQPKKRKGRDDQEPPSPEPHSSQQQQPSQGEPMDDDDENRLLQGDDTEGDPMEASGSQDPQQEPENRFLYRDVVNNPLYNIKKVLFVELELGTVDVSSFDCTVLAFGAAIKDRNHAVHKFCKRFMEEGKTKKSWPDSLVIGLDLST